MEGTSSSSVTDSIPTSSVKILVKREENTNIARQVNFDNILGTSRYRKKDFLKVAKDKKSKLDYHSADDARDAMQYKQKYYEIVSHSEEENILSDSRLRQRPFSYNKEDNSTIKRNRLSPDLRMLSNFRSHSPFLSPATKLRTQHPSSSYPISELQQQRSISPKLEHRQEYSKNKRSISPRINLEYPNKNLQASVLQVKGLSSRTSPQILYSPGLPRHNNETPSRPPRMRF